jgi:hypothetical protein
MKVMMKQAGRANEIKEQIGKQMASGVEHY